MANALRPLAMFESITGRTFEQNEPPTQGSRFRQVTTRENDPRITRGACAPKSSQQEFGRVVARLRSWCKCYMKTKFMLHISYHSFVHDVYAI